MTPDERTLIESLINSSPAPGMGAGFDQLALREALLGQGAAPPHQPSAAPPRLRLAQGQSEALHRPGAVGPDGRPAGDEGAAIRADNVKRARQMGQSYFDQFSPEQLQRYLETGEEPAGLWERWSAQRLREETTPAARARPPAAPRAPSGGAGEDITVEMDGQSVPSRRVSEQEAAELLRRQVKDALEQSSVASERGSAATPSVQPVDLNQYLAPGARAPSPGEERARLIAQVKAALAATDPATRNTADQFLNRYGSTPGGVALNTATLGASDRAGEALGLYGPGELQFARELAAQTHPMQNLAAQAVGAVVPATGFARLLRLLLSAAPQPGQPGAPAGGNPGSQPSGSGAPRTRATPGSGRARGGSSSRPSGSGAGRQSRSEEGRQEGHSDIADGFEGMPARDALLEDQVRRALELARKKGR